MPMRQVRRSDDEVTSHILFYDCELRITTTATCTGVTVGEKDMFQQETDPQKELTKGREFLLYSYM